MNLKSAFIIATASSALMLGIGGCGKENSPPPGGQSDPAVSTACSGSPVLGSWHETTNAANTFQFRADCTGDMSNCSTGFTYPNVTASNGDVTIHVISAISRPGCDGLGDHQCQYALMDQSHLFFNCGGRNVSLIRN